MHTMSGTVSMWQCPSASARVKIRVALLVHEVFPMGRKDSQLSTLSVICSFFLCAGQHKRALNLQTQLLSAQISAGDAIPCCVTLGSATELSL